jgi:hypothetical protein
LCFQLKINQTQRLYENAAQMPTLIANARRHIRKDNRSTPKRKNMNPFQGWIGEKKTTFYLWLSLPKKSYYTFHNVILPSKN